MSFTAFYMVLLVGLTWAKDPDICCTKGYKRGALILSNNGNCKPDASVASEFKGLNKVMCIGFYKQCCITTAKLQFCQMGERLALANQLCLTTDLVGGEAQKLCCECCKRGRAYGIDKGSCEEQYSDFMCTTAFKNCCERAQKQRTTEKPNINKTCKDVTCDLGKATGCEETSSGPQCLCKQGYILKKDDKTCEDVNECATNLHNCQGADICRNSPGTYKCVACEKGYKKVSNICQKIDVSKCEDGFEYKNGKCVDINECIAGSHRCPTRSFCLNVEGDYRCLKNCFYPNYEIVRDSVCADVDECKANTHNCYKNFECQNSVGSYNCKRVRCDEGYKLVNGYCEDIDECEQKNICGKMGNCRNAHGRYYCDCQAGYTVNPKTGKCVDIDECKTNRAYCNYKCINTEGSYRCSCPSGYETRGRYCHDIDECSVGKPCNDSSFCFNTFGSYACINQSCPDPFFIRTARKDEEPATCMKVCHGNETCRKIPLQSVKRVTYNFYRTVNYRDFLYTYWTGFEPKFYRVNVYFAKGNEENYFYIETLSEKKVRIINHKEITGPKSFNLVMYADVKSKRRNVLHWRYEYQFHVAVGRYDFA